MMTARTAAASAFLLASCACAAAVAAAEPPANGLNDLLATGSANVYSKVLPDYADYGDEANGGGGIIGAGSDYFYSDPYSVSRRSDMVASYTGGNDISQAPSNLNHRMQEIPLSFDAQSLQDLKESRADQMGHRAGIGGDPDLDYHVGHLRDDPHGALAWPSSEPLTFTHWTKHLMQEHSVFKFAVYFTVTFFFAAFVLISVTKLIYGDAASVDLTRILPTGYGEESSAAVAVEEGASSAERVFKMIENFTENFIGAAAGDGGAEGGDSSSSGEGAIKPIGAENTTETDPMTEVTPFYSPVISTTLPPQDESTKKSASLRSNDDVEDDEDENSINSMLQGLVHNQDQLSKMTMEEKLRLMEILEEQKMRLMGYTTEKGTTTTTTSRPTTNRNLNQAYADLNAFYKGLNEEDGRDIFNSARGLGVSTSAVEKVETKLSRRKRQLPVFGFLSFLMLLLNSVMLIVENININNNNNNNNNNDNNNNNNNLNMNTNGRGLFALFEDLTTTVITSLLKGEEEDGETNKIVEENKSFGYLNNLNRVEYGALDDYKEDKEEDKMPQFFYPGMENLTMYRRHWTTPASTTASTTTTTTSTTATTTVAKTTTTSFKSANDVLDDNMDTDIVPMALRNDNLVRRQKEPKATIIFAAPQYPSDSPAKRYRFSVDSGTVITPNMIAGGGAKAKGERPVSEKDTTTTSTTASTTTMTAETSTSPAPPPNTIILGRILRPSSSAEITARPRFTLFVKDRLERPVEPSKTRGGVTVMKTHEAEEVIHPEKMKKRVTGVSQLKEALGYGEEDRRELWQLLGRRKRDAEERQGSL